jgi:hypothetical protein
MLLRSLRLSYGEKENIIWKNGNSGGGVGSNEIPVSTGFFFSPRSLHYPMISEYINVLPIIISISSIFVICCQNRASL